MSRQLVTLVPCTVSATPAPWPWRGVRPGRGGEVDPAGEEGHRLAALGVPASGAAARAVPVVERLVAVSAVDVVRNVLLIPLAPAEVTARTPVVPSATAIAATAVASASELTLLSTTRGHCYRETGTG